MEEAKTIHPESLVTKTFSRIESEHIAPRPRWHFLLTNNAFWGVWCFSVFVGANAVAASIFAFENSGWEFYTATHDSFLEFLLESLPYLWIGTILLFTGVGYYNFRHTKRGYRYSLPFIIFFSVAASVVGGILFYIFGFGEIIDEELGARIPFHRPVLVELEVRWVAPTRGVLAGDIVNIDDTNDFILRAFDGTEWMVETSNLENKDLEILHDFPRVRVVGLPFDMNATSSRIFHACFIFPWKILGNPSWKEEISHDPRTEHTPSHFIERNTSDDRSNACRGVRPYDTLQRMRNLETTSL